MVSLHGHPSNGLLETVKGVFPKRTQGEPGTLHTNWDSYPKDKTPLHEKGTLISFLDMGTGCFQQSCSRGSPWRSQRPRLHEEEERKKSVWTSGYDFRGHHENPYWGDHLFFMSWFTVFRSWGTGLLSGLKLVNSCLSQGAPSPAAGSRWIFCCHSRPRSQSLAQTSSAFLSSCTLVSWRWIGRTTGKGGACG